MLLIVWRVLHLYHCIDLAVLRCAWGKDPDAKLYFAAKRKGWRTYKWKRVLTLRHDFNVCPASLMASYKRITHEGHCVEPGPLLWVLLRLYGPLTSERIGPH